MWQLVALYLLLSHLTLYQPLLGKLKCLLSHFTDKTGNSGILSNKNLGLSYLGAQVSLPGCCSASHQKNGVHGNPTLTLSPGYYNDTRISRMAFYHLQSPISFNPTVKGSH